MTETEDRCSCALPVLVLFIVAQAGSSSLRGNSQGASFDHPILEFEIAETARVSAVAFSPDGSILAVATLSGALRLWDAKVGKEIRTLPRPAADMDQAPPWLSIAALSLSPDGRILACGGGGVTYGQASSIEVGLWDIES